MNPLISIIIPTFNRADIIGETLDSIRNLNYINWECIIIDDGSSDDTFSVVQNYINKDIRFQYFIRPSIISKGPNSCRNFGYAKSKGSFIKWFDSDDLFMPNALDYFFNNEIQNIDAVVCKLQRVDLTTNYVRSENNIVSDNLIQDYLIGKVAFYICGPTWKRSFLEKQNDLFDESITNLDDWDFNLRMLYQKPKIKYINDPLILYRIHNNSLSHEIEKLNLNEIKSELKAREKHLYLLNLFNLKEVSVLASFIKNRSKLLLRESLINNSLDVQYFLLQKVFLYQIKRFDVLDLIQTWFGFVVFKIFKKGYKFLK